MQENPLHPHTFAASHFHIHTPLHLLASNKGATALTSTKLQTVPADRLESKIDVCGVENGTGECILQDDRCHELVSQLKRQVRGFRNSSIAEARKKLRDKSILLTGDSTVRRLFWALCSFLMADYARIDFDRFGAGNTIFGADCPEVAKKLNITLTYRRATELANTDQLLDIVKGRGLSPDLRDKKEPFDIVLVGMSWWQVLCFTDSCGNGFLCFEPNTTEKCHKFLQRNLLNYLTMKNMKPSFQEYLHNYKYVLRSTFDKHFHDGQKRLILSHLLAGRSGWKNPYETANKDILKFVYDAANEARELSGSKTIFVDQASWMHDKSNKKKAARHECMYKKNQYVGPKKQGIHVESMYGQLLRVQNMLCFILDICRNQNK